MNPCCKASYLSVLAGVLFVVSLFVYFNPRASICNDLSQYLVAGQNLVAGKGLVSVLGERRDQRPGMPVLLAGVILIFGKNLSTVAWLLEITAAAMVSMIFLLGARLFDWRVGLSASLAYLLSPPLWKPATLVLDPLWAALVIASLLVLLLRQKGHDALVGVASGLLAFAALFAKEMGLLFLPAPALLYWFKVLPGRGRRVVWFYLTALTPLVVWFLAHGTALRLGRLRQYADFLDRIGHHAAQESWLVAVLSLVNKILTGIYQYWASTSYGPGMLERLPFVWLALPALLVVMVRALFNRKPEIIISVMMVLYLPLTAAVGLYNARISTDLLTISLLFISLAAMLFKAWDYLLSRRPLETGRRHNGVAWAAVAVLVVASLSFNGFPAPPRLAASFSGMTKSLRELGQREVFFRGREMARWIQENARPGSRVIFSKEMYANALFWFAGDRYGISIIHESNFTDRFYKHPRDRQPHLANKILLLSSLPFFTTYTGFILVPREDLLDYLKKHPEAYVVLSRARHGALGDWLVKQGLLEKRAHIGNPWWGLAIYKASTDLPQVSQLDQTVLIDGHAWHKLRWMQQRQPRRYAWFKRELLQRVIGLDDQAIEALLRGEPSPQYKLIPVQQPAVGP